MINVLMEEKIAVAKKWNVRTDPGRQTETSSRGSREVTGAHGAL